MLNDNNEDLMLDDCCIIEVEECELEASNYNNCCRFMELA